MAGNNKNQGALIVLRRRVEDIIDELENVLLEIDDIVKENGTSTDNSVKQDKEPYYYQFINSEDLYEPLLMEGDPSNEVALNYFRKKGIRD